MLIKDIKPIDRFGINLLKTNNPDELIKELIELPLQKPCAIFREKGIETCMSSANANNIMPFGKRRIEKEDVFGKGQEWYFPRPTFEDAGRGYAWIMLNYNSLSKVNKNFLLSLEQKKGKKGEMVGGKAIWFVEPSIVMFDCLDDKNSPDLEGEEFKKRRIILSYNDRYASQSVFLRMPINKTTTVEEVEDFFTQFARSFETQVREKDTKSLQTR